MSHYEPKIALVGNYAYWIDINEPLGEQFMYAPRNPATNEVAWSERKVIDAFQAMDSTQQQFLFSVLDFLYEDSNEDKA